MANRISISKWLTAGAFCVSCGAAQAQLFSDDFTRGSDPGPLAPWTAQSGNWTVTQGVMQGGTNTSFSYGYATITNSWTNYSVQARLKFPVGAFGGGLGGRLNPATGAHYAAWIYPENSAGGSNTLKLIKFQTYTSFGFHGTSGAAMQSVNLASVGTNFHTVRLDFSGNQIAVYLDGTNRMIVTDDEVLPYLSGAVSLGFWTDAAGYLMTADDVVVTALPVVANDDSYTNAFGATLTVSAPGVLANDLGGNGGALNALLDSGPVNGILSLSTNGSFTYTPAANFAGNDSFTYVATDGQTTSTVATVTITVTPDHAPIANNDLYQVVLNQILTVAAPGVLGNDTDPDGNSLTVTLLSDATNGLLQLGDDGGFSYTPDPGFVGVDSFVYQASDGFTNSGPARVTISVQRPAWFADNFARATDPGPLAPWLVQAGAWSVTGGELRGGTNTLFSYGFAYLTNSWTNYSVEAKVRFPTGGFGGGVGGRLNPATGAHYAAWLYPGNQSGNSNVLALVKFQNYGSFGYTNVPGAVMNRMDLGPVGTNSHSLKLGFLGNRISVFLDGVQMMSMVDVEAQPYSSGAVSLDFWTDVFGYSMLVDEVIVSPLAADDSYVVDEDTTLSVAAAGVLATDTEMFGSNLTAVLVSTTTNGVLNLNNDGSFTYLPATNFNGRDFFSYQANDGTNNLGTAGVSIRVAPVNDAPVLPPQTNRTIGVLSTLIVTNTATDVDLPPDTLTYVLQIAPTNATISGTGVITWTPTTAQSPSTNIFQTVVTDDGQPPLSATNSFTVTVNSDPVIVVNSTTLALESCAPGNGAVDPGELVTVSFALKNIGAGNTTNLIVTLLQTNGIVLTSGSQTYGALTPGGPAVSQPFTFASLGACGSNVLVTFQLQDGAASLGFATTTIVLGQIANVFTQNFDSVTAPALPSGWTTSASGAQSNWVTQTSVRDTFPNSAFSRDVAGVGVNELVSPALTLPAGQSQLSFRNNYDLEGTGAVAYDGGVLEIKIGANAFLDLLAAGGSFVSGGYNTTIDGGFSNPLGGRQAWSGSSSGFITTLINLPLAAAGQSVQFRWRCATDNGGTSGAGWRVDTIAVSGRACCVNGAPVLPGQANRTIAELTSLVVTNSATDPSSPGGLTYSLLSPPSGAAIDSTGVITWTPTEAQGPSTNTITTVVTDNGVPPLSATNSFTVVVTEVNSAPVLPVQANRTIGELTTLNVNNAATDADLPPNTLTYSLLNPPAGAQINSIGLITWTPTEAQGPSTNTITTVVTDNGVPPLSATNSFIVVVNEVNSAPVLSPQSDRTIAELTTLTVSNPATDSDIPANILSYALLNPPAGALISASGVITWTPTEAQGPSTNLIVTVATDNGVPPMSATNSFTVVATEVNSAPVLPLQADRTVAELVAFSVTNTATDADLPANVLSYSLVNPPDGAVIDTNGVITWTPSEAQGPGTNLLKTIVTDNGVPPLSATNTFTVVVTEVNSAPVLPLQADQTVSELTLLTVTNTAADSDLPANLLSYALINPPAGAVIDNNGVISWTPSEAQGPSINVLTTVVTDNGVPPLSATNSFTVVVTEVNSVPVLPPQADQTIAELTLLIVTNTATDADLPANILSYTLTNPPAGATIDTNGVISWTPSEAQGPSVNVLTTVVTDNGVPPLSATNSFTVVVTEVNSAPVLPPQADQTIAELTLLIVTNTATDADLPANILSYTLVNPPAGATIDTNGVISWTPSEAQGPSINVLTTVVTDNGVPPLSATNSFTVAVTEVNSAPVLPPQADQTIAELTLLIVTNTATDADLPANILSYALANPPAGATIDTNGVISWTPSEAQGPSINVLTTVVTDNGVPPLSATNSFTVVVTEVNSAPVLPPQADQTIAELTLLIVTNTAIDADLPANILSYTLANPPAGATIDTNGVISWTPSEAQGPSINVLTTVVTDNGVPPLSATNSFTVVVTEVNSAPVLPPQADQTIAELTLLIVTNTATDADLPANILTYALANPPAGATIDTNGVISWTPSEAQGPSINVLTTVVTDNGVPPLSATNSFTVVVTEVNSAPVLPPQADQTIAELTLLIVTNTATDADLPANILSYTLANPPAGATIDTNGVISWTPSEAQGPSISVLTTVVTDNGVPPLSATNSFTVAVTEVNSAPVLPSQADLTVGELTSLTVTNTASDTDLPANILSYSLVNPPAGAVIDNNGVITWTPSEAQGPSINVLTTVVTDNGVPPLSATNSFTVVVTEVNSAPVLPPQADQTIAELTLLIVTNTATDADLPANILSYTLVNPPAGATIDTNGVISWIPSEAQGPSINVLTTVVADNGVPPLSATNSFTVAVTEVNSAPVLPPQADQTIAELTLLIVTNTATDADLPANILSYTLVNPPAGATIDTNGVISWIPSEAQGPSINVLTTIVTDNGVPPLGATNSFTVTVTEVNSAPVLPPQADQTVSELTLLIVTNTATDADLPANILSYALLNPPAGATIDTNGVISWTPSEAQGPGTNVLTTVVADNGVPPLSATNSFTVVVTEVNTAPVLPAQSDLTIAELTTLTVTNTATDADLPANILSYALLNPPVGAVIDTNGVISWTPREAQGPGTNVLTTVVTDNGVPRLSATNSFTVVVTEVNSAPVLPAQSDRTVAELTTLTVTNAATDSDLPANTLTYALLNPPVGAAIDINGVITWTPTEAQGPGTNVLTTVVTDSGVPALSATNSFTVVVTEVNTAPVLPPQPNRTIAELTTFTVTNTATDADIPSNTLTYALLSPPNGASINSNGVITWRPRENQGPGTFILTTVVTDNGVPALSATNSFTVVVTEVNTAPVLPTQADRTVAELTTLTVNNTASDPDVPANILSYSLPVAPVGATIDVNGIITWTPTEAQGPSTNTIKTVVTDNGVPPLSATNTFTVVVTEVNSAPVLPSQPNRTLAELTTLTVTNAATDSDLPANILSYALLNPPAGAAVDNNGVITWTPTEAQGPSTNMVTTVVTDNGVPPLSATNSFTVVVTEVNTAPVLPAQSDHTVTELSTLIVTNAATDADLPANILNYSLLAPPTGATINSNGVIVWTPALGQGPSTNTLTTVVTDNGSPALSATNRFIVVVQVFVPQFRITSIQVTNHLATITWNSVTNQTYRLQYVSSLGATNWQDAGEDVPSAGTSTSTTDSLGNTPQRFYRVKQVQPQPPRIHLSVGGGLATVTWNSIAGKTYRLQYRDSLNAAIWQDVVPDITATGSSASVTNSVVGAAQRYFRLQVLP